MIPDSSFSFEFGISIWKYCPRDSTTDLEKKNASQIDISDIRLKFYVQPLRHVCFLLTHTRCFWTISATEASTKMDRKQIDSKFTSKLKISGQSGNRNSV